MLAWTWLVPTLSIVLLVGAITAGVGSLLAVLCATALIGVVLAAVHHAEVVAHRMGEPLGTLVLAIAVTVIEASLILSMMVAGGAAAAVLPRDTIYAAVMITPSISTAALARAAARIGALLCAEPRLRGIDINPLIAYPRGQGVFALDALLVLGDE